MEISNKLRKKLLASILNIALILGVFVVLFPLSMPTTKADTLWYESWTISSGQDITLDDDILIINGTLTIEGTLTLDNCTIQMRFKSPDDPGGDLIHVEEGGTFNLLNNSLITTNSTSPDPYEFRIDGATLIENSTVEKMKNIDTEYASMLSVTLSGIFNYKIFRLSQFISFLENMT